MHEFSPTGYLVICSSTSGLDTLYVDGFSALDSADSFARDPRATPYTHNLDAEQRAWIFANYSREVVATVRP